MSNVTECRLSAGRGPWRRVGRAGGVVSTLQLTSTAGPWLKRGSLPKTRIVCVPSAMPFSTNGDAQAWGSAVSSWHANWVPGSAVNANVADADVVIFGGLPMRRGAGPGVSIEKWTTIGGGRRPPPAPREGVAPPARAEDSFEPG